MLTATAHPDGLVYIRRRHGPGDVRTFHFDPDCPPPVRDDPWIALVKLDYARQLGRVPCSRCIMPTVQGDAGGSDLL